MVTVREVVQDKGNDVWSVGPRASVYEALELMAEKNIGAVAVLECDALVGMFSERDYARKVILKGKSSKDTHVAELMSRDIRTVAPDQTVEDCMRLMTDQRIRHLPVIEKGNLMGLVSIGDIVNTIISAQQTTIQSLEGYISGGSYGAQ